MAPTDPPVRGTDGPASGTDPPYMREKGALCQIGVSTRKPCTFWVKSGSFSAVWRYKNEERFSKAVEAKLHIPSPCLDAKKKVFHWNL